ncbi:poly-beta-1,6 N-acetyl-D-glucosamine synthase [Phaeovibrio sulfidiphilus]|uniref:Poly-beta-1,6-N-acetyl-D-glucosamine synthase n=1 Tax=Phaeovibrio sulfidiphilus TaxID=1220600 RepID=A0A8J7CD87_9PROT|nr:poly-beta-1,6-N-acetyl-D-glucosamine synthase [Phaeovibrio sulfidiphilus]MBE1236859.1 poly-beta-1,6 N-acetyl-D-glucosamine synthase [Phaeovibrio sulfidiphilus]
MNTERVIGIGSLVFAALGPFVLALFFHSSNVMYFVFLYPLFMSGIWMAGGLYFMVYRERKWNFTRETMPEPLPGNPLVSVLIPCYNEELNAVETITAALASVHRNIEVIAINDGSRDRTAEILDRLALEDPRLRVLHLAENQGKAVALRMAAMTARSDILVCIDGDAMLDPRAVSYLALPLLMNPRVGVVTGNPRIRTRSTLVGRIQVGEFSSIIGLIKRTQRIYGQVFTVSGVVAAFRRRALDDVGYWSPDMITEDIDISWKLQLRHWPVFYEPRAMCWILMPETLKGLWKQRLRWAQGGAEIFLKNSTKIWAWRHRRMWTIFFEFVLSTLWSFCYATSVLLYVLGFFLIMPDSLQVQDLLPPAFTGMVLAAACVIQFTVSLYIDRIYEHDIGKWVVWIIWYPFAFWMLNMLTTVAAFPKAMLVTNKKRARWTFDDRGLARSKDTS